MPAKICRGSTWMWLPCGEPVVHLYRVVILEHVYALGVGGAHGREKLGNDLSIDEGIPSCSLYYNPYRLQDAHRVETSYNNTR